MIGYDKIGTNDEGFQGGISSSVGDHTKVADEIGLLHSNTSVLDSEGLGSVVCRRR